MSVKTRTKTIMGTFKRAERRALIAWIRFAQAHRESHVLPFALFGILFLDGFLMIVPSMLCLIAATMISPQKWYLFAIIFGVSSTTNCIVLYFIGRTVPVDTLVSFIGFLNLEWVWESAREALRDYGAYATLVGALLGAPTQLIMAMIGAADASAIDLNGEVGSRFTFATSMTFAGQFSKAIVLAALTRYGWVRLEKKFGRDEIQKKL